MSAGFMDLKRWMNLMPALLFLVAVCGTAAASLEWGGKVSALSESAGITPVIGDSIDGGEASPLFGETRARMAPAVPALPGVPAVPARQPAAVGKTPAAADKEPAASRTPSQETPAASYPTVQVVATGYTAGVESTGKRPGHPAYGITYSGVKVRRDLVSTVAADPKVFPIGTLLYIPGYGYGVVADTGSAIKGHKLDLYFETKRDVFRHWGKRKVEVQVLRKGEGKLKEAWLNEINTAVSVSATKKIPKSYTEM